MGKPVSPDLSKVESESINRQRHVQPVTTSHRRISVSSIVQADPLKVILPTDEVTLKRHLGVFSGVCFIVGIIVGSGIFISPSGVLKETNSVGLCLIVWVLCGILALLGALCYAEIGTIIPRNGAEVAYLREGIGSVHVRSGDILAYLFNWANTFILKPVSSAVLALTFAEYFLRGITGECGIPDTLVKMVAAFTLMMLTNINALSVTAANHLNIFFVICKAVTVGVVIITGLVRIGQGHTIHLSDGFAGTYRNPLRVALAFYEGLWSYDGWNSLNSVTEELKNPKRNLWLSIAIALPSITVIYLLTNISYFTVLSKEQMMTSGAVAEDWGDFILGRFVRVLLVLIAFSALGSANGSLFAASRACMVGAQYGYLPDVFACIHTKALTPLPAIVLQGVLGIAFCIPSGIHDLIQLFNFCAWIFYGLTFLATIFCKYTKKDEERVINIPLPLVILSLIMSIYLIVAPLVKELKLAYLSAMASMLIGLVFYYPFVYRKIEWKFMSKINNFLKLFFDLQRAQVKL